MPKPDLSAYAARVVVAVKSYVAKSEASLSARLDAIEATLKALPAPRDGRDGQPGADGKDGKDGAPGRDGFNLEDIQVEMGADGRTLSLKFVRGDEIVQRDIHIPAMLYRGVWREGGYEHGDVVTWGGSAWHCAEKTTDKPGSSSAWRLMVKEGRQGKDGKDGGPPASPAPVRFK